MTGLFDSYPEWRGAYDNYRPRPGARTDPERLTGLEKMDRARPPLVADPRGYLDEEADMKLRHTNCNCILEARPGSRGDSTPAIETCWTDIGGRMWAGNGEYVSQVNYCPRCGTKARTQGTQKAPRNG